MKTQKYISLLVASLVIASFAITAPAFAKTNSGLAQGTVKSAEAQRPAVVGKVSAINGNILTVIANQGFNKTAAATTATFTVDAKNAKLLRGKTAITLSDITVGDNVMVQGTVTGTSVVATTIQDGKVGNGNNQALPQIQGNGQPVVAGSVTAISGSTITITNKSNVTYTVDATNAKFVENGVTNPTISNVAVADSVVVQGTVNGTSVTASIIIDQQLKAADNKTNQANNGTSRGFMGGMMNGIGSFFKHMFGF